MLGHEVPFSYCRQPGKGIPCRKIFDCWWETIDIKGFVEKNFSEEIQAALHEPPKPKMLSLLDIIEQARRNTASESDSINAQRE